jgi:hypothetical protein
MFVDGKSLDLSIGSVRSPVQSAWSVRSGLPIRRSARRCRRSFKLSSLKIVSYIISCRRSCLVMLYRRVSDRNVSLVRLLLCGGVRSAHFGRIVVLDS